MFRRKQREKVMYQFFVTNEETGEGYWVLCNWKRKELHMLHLEDSSNNEDELEDWLESLHDKWRKAK